MECLEPDQEPKQVRKVYIQINSITQIDLILKNVYSLVSAAQSRKLHVIRHV